MGLLMSPKRKSRKKKLRDSELSSRSLWLKQYDCTVLYNTCMQHISNPRISSTLTVENPLNQN
uniref:Uncharacterized protein n=1 Tax=Brassica campestris TaxID=3711 RepID=A0A3P5ZGY2_BRACM|nr:unnamed protein product [Brassica rapa]